jgi:hypothetical protein
MPNVEINLSALTVMDTDDISWPTANSSGDPGFTFFHAPQFTPVFNGVRVARSSVCCVMFCRLFFVLFFWPLYCLSFFWLPLLVSSNFSYVYLKTGMISFSEGLNIWQLNGHDMSYQKKTWQYRGKKRTKNNLKYITQKTEDRATRTPLKTGVNWGAWKRWTRGLQKS